MGGYKVKHEKNHDPSFNLVDDLSVNLGQLRINDVAERSERRNQTGPRLLPMHPRNLAYRYNWGRYTRDMLPSNVNYEPFWRDRNRRRRTFDEWMIIRSSRCQNEDIFIEMSDDEEEDGWEFHEEWQENLRKEQKIRPVSKEAQKKWKTEKWIALYNHAKSRQSKKRFKWTYY